MFEQAFQNIDNILRNELRGTTKVDYNEQNSGLHFREYLDGLEQGKADEARPLLERLEHIADEPRQALGRYLFAAATSELMTSGRVPTLPRCHFFLLTAVEPDVFLAELAEVPDGDWEKNSRHKISVQRETRSIELSVRATKCINNRHDQYVRPSDNAEHFPYLMNWLRSFSSVAGRGTLQLARIVKLKPQGQVYKHVDRGLYYLIRDRYHLVLQSRSGSKMQCESQTCIWYSGQAWWFNNHVVHQAFNESGNERIHVIFDVLPHRNQILVPYFQQYAASSER